MKAKIRVFPGYTPTRLYPIIHFARLPNRRYISHVKASEMTKMRTAITGTCNGMGRCHRPMRIKTGPTTK